MKKIYSIYSMKNNITSQVYIGQSTITAKRIQHHLYSAARGVKGPLYDAIRLYGINNFTITILDTITTSNKRDANNLEQSYISTIPEPLRYNVMVKGHYTNNNLVKGLKQRPVRSINLTTGEELIHPSIYAAAIHFTGVANSGAISPILKGVKHSLYGHTFKYVEA